VSEPQWVEDEFGKVELSSIATYGDVIHTFVNRSATKARTCPATSPRSRRTGADPGVGLMHVDHVVGNVELGRMQHWVEFYERVFGMTEMIHFSDEDISTEYSALMSKVLTTAGEDQVPDQRAGRGEAKSQIEEYLEFNHGPGSQHVALASTNIVETVEALQERGVIFLARPRPTTRTSATASARSTSRGTTSAAADPRRPRRRRVPAPDLHEDGAGPADALLRGDRAPRRARLRRRATSRRSSRRSSASRRSAEISSVRELLEAPARQSGQPR
jgi:hypothetical protein